MGLIQNKQQEQQMAAKQPSAPSMNTVLNSFLDANGLRKRFQSLLGERTPQFLSSIVSIVNADENMQKAFQQSPMSVVQAGLKAATMDLPIEHSLGYAYIVAFKNSKKGGIYEAKFIPGWKGYNQLALRTGAYKTINVVDVREGELRSYNRLTEEIDIDFIEDDQKREGLPVIGYVGFYKLVNGAEKTIYRTVKNIEAHERKFRKGDYMGKGWKDDWDAMARKTVFRELIGKWGVMSISYQNQKEGAMLADAITADDQAANVIDTSIVPDAEQIPVDESTGEVVADA